jgi:photosynthetic reaction center cytochrome c subunit
MTEKDWWDRLTQRPLVEWIPFRLVALTLAGFTVMFVVGVLKWPTDTKIDQWGFRGTGMAQVYNEKGWEQAMKQVAAIPASDEPIPAGEGTLLASEAYENVQVLGHLTEDNFLRLMTAITEWVSPEQGCAYCHGEDGNFVHDDLYTKVVSRRMIQMTMAINSQWASHVAPAGVNCYTCHRGLNVPANIWFNEEADDAKVVGWRNNQNLPNPRVASTDLPSNVFEEFLVKDREIRVINTGLYGNEHNNAIKDTEWTFGLMVHMSKALNVNCAYCHNTRSMNVWEQSPPQRTTAWYGIRMVRDLNNTYLDPLQPVYPAHRLGPTGDAPKANCTTCHQGVYKPLFGTPMITNWPELSGPGPAAPAEEKQAMAD